MPKEKRMSIEERRTYLRIQRERYHAASRGRRSELLSEMEEVTSLHRKSLIRLLNGDLERRPHERERSRTYGPAVQEVLRVISESRDHICAERLTPSLLSMAEHLARHGEFELSPAVREKLARISVSTVRRLLRGRRGKGKKLPRKGPQRNTKLTRLIPMERIPWHETRPGHFEVDLVHHSGPHTSGDYIHTLQMIDVATGWSERYAILGRSFLVMRDAFQSLLARLPIPILEIHSDNGSEFLNYHLLRFWNKTDPHIKLSRNRPWCKNDSRFVEQKNATLVRAYLGHKRFDTVDQSGAINELYEKMGLYYNLFQPVMRLQEKIRLPSEKGQPRRFKRRFDVARTPFERLSSTTAITQEEKEKLQRLREAINPRALRLEIFHLIARIRSLPSAAPGQVQDVWLTLSKNKPKSQKGD